MFKTEKIEKLVRYAIMTGFIKRESAPVSLMLVAPPESNKTSILKLFECVKGVKYTTDLSGKPLAEFLRNARDDKYYHLIVPDFIKIVSHKQHIVSGVMTTLNAMIEEGVRTSMYYGQELDLKKNVQCGLITSITPALYMQQFRAWNDLGLLSRFITVSYTYSEETRLEIIDLIAGDGKKSLDKEIISMKRGGAKDIGMSNDVLAGLKLYAGDLAIKLRSYHITSWEGGYKHDLILDIQGFRLVKHLKLLLKAIAFDKGLKEANYECLAELRGLIEYMNMPDKPKVL